MSESLFTSQTPSSANASDGTPGITTATTIRAAVAGQITHVRFYATTTVGGTYTVEVWAPTNDDAAPAGTLLASKVMGAAPTGGAWNTVALDTPVSRTAGQPFRVAVHNSQGRYVATVGFFSSVDLVNGNLTADADGDDPFLFGAMRQGVFAISATAGVYPSNGNGTSYFVDVLFETGTTVNANAALAVTDTVTTTATVDRAGQASVAVVDTIAAAATVDRPADASLSTTATVASTALALRPGDAALAGVAAIAATANVSRSVDAALGVTVTVAAFFGGPDMDVTIGSPLTSWVAGAPQNRWFVGTPQA